MSGASLWCVEIMAMLLCTGGSRVTQINSSSAVLVFFSPLVNREDRCLSRLTLTVFVRMSLRNGRELETARGRTFCFTVGDIFARALLSDFRTTGAYFRPSNWTHIVSVLDSLEYVWTWEITIPATRFKERWYICSRWIYLSLLCCCGC